jgi:hypothetical protein
MSDGQTQRIQALGFENRSSADDFCQLVRTNP